MAYTLKVNGKSQTVDVEADTPLLWVLRDTIGLVGSKFGCGIGLCGACTVHLDGVAVRSCQTQISTVGTKAVTTIEGVGATPIGQKVQTAWIDHDVIQCGYCQAGQIMSAAALLAKTPQPTDVQIDRAMSGNICRCATYTRIKSAIRQAAGITPALAEAPAPQQVLAAASTATKA
jgi:isoquinoline 1-oxidoreductase alpha subunit